MSTKHFRELKNLTADELKTRVRESEAKQFDTKMKKATGQLENTGMLWQLRKEIARLKTLQTAGQSATQKAGK